MTREDSILTKIWVTNDGRCLTVNEITDDHLRAIRNMLLSELTPGRDEESYHKALAAWMADHAKGLHADDEEMDHDAFRAGWIQIVNVEIARRLTWLT